MTILDRRGQFDISPFFPLAHLGLARAPAIARYNEKPPSLSELLCALERRDADIPILIEAKQEYEELK